MLKYSILAIVSVCILAGCASSPYETANGAANFNGKTTITGNIQNLCTATNGKYAFKITKHLAGGFDGQNLFSCTTTKTVSYGDNYQLYFSIVKNDGTGKNVVNQCDVVHTGTQTKLSKVYIQFTNDGGTPSCVAKVS